MSADDPKKYDNGQGRMLSGDEIAAMQPGLARLMPEVGARTWKLYYAAKAKNWPLAKFQLKEAVKLLKLCGVTRPKYEKDLASYVAADMQKLMDAIEAEDLARFEKEFETAIRHANGYHTAYGKGFLRWKVPDFPPPDLDLTPR